MVMVAVLRYTILVRLVAGEMVVGIGYEQAGGEPIAGGIRVSEDTSMRVKLVSVLGDQGEFTDLIGQVGDLHIREKTVSFDPTGRDDWLVMDRKRLTRRDGTVKVSTQLGNTFTFQDLDYFTKKY